MGWIDGWTGCNFTSVLTVFQPYQGDEIVIIDNDKLSAMEPHQWLENFPPPMGLNLGLLVQQVSAEPTE